MAFKYSVVLETLSMGGPNVLDDLPKILKTIRGAGFDAIDVPDDPQKAREIREIANPLGLAIPAIVGAWAFWHGGEERDLGSRKEDVRKTGIAYARRCIDLAVEVGASILEICAVPTVLEYPVCSEPLAIIRQNFVESTREICLYAEKSGVDILIEPINRFEGYAGFINNFDDALSVIGEVDAPNLGVLADFFHMNIECVSICESLRDASDRVRHVHLADSNRLAPGCGHIDFSAVLRTLADIGFDGYMSLDCVPAKPDVNTFLEKSIAYMKQLERTVELQKAIYRMDIEKGKTG